MRRLQLAAALLVFGTAFALLLVPACQKVPTVAGGGAAMSLFANPGTVPPDGVSTISLTLFEASGQPVPDGTRVTFTTNLGTVEPDAIGVQGGYASVTFHASATTGGATITASSGATTATITVTIGGTGTALVLEAQPARLPAGGGDSTIVATVRDASGTLVAGVPVEFSTDKGRLRSAGLAPLSGADGRAYDLLTTTLDAKVTAKIKGGTASADVVIDVAGTGATHLTVSATPASLGPGGGTTSIEAQALDASMSPVPGFPVAFSTSAGTLAVQGAINADASGVARNQLTTSSSATVTATGAGATGSVSVSVGRPTPANLKLVVSVSPVKVDKNVVQVPPAREAACNDPTSIDLTITATLTSGTAAVEGALVSVSVSKAATGARVLGHFCELAGDPAYVTDVNGEVVVHYTLSAAEITTCDNIQVPCGSARCAAATPCGLATPTPSVTPFGSNDCCCGFIFTARVGTTFDDSLPVGVLNDQNCTTGNKLCGCVF